MSEHLWRVLSLQDHNTRVVIFGTAILGFAAGLVGCLTLLRRRALVGDALAHAALPGIAGAFLIATAMGGEGKSLPILLAGATVSGLFGIVSILLIRKMTRIKEDAALGIILSVYFGLGVALLGIVTQMNRGNAAGLESFIYGKTATMTAGDARLIAVASAICVLICIALLKEFKLLCFDEAFAGARGYPVVLLDAVLMSVVVVVTIVGLQAVGLVLVIALLVIPAASARFWTDRLVVMMVIASVLGMTGSFVGAAVSAMLPRLPSGAMIVLAAGFGFLVSFLIGTRRGVLVRLWRRRKLNESIDHQHLLRELYEMFELDPSRVSVPYEELLERRSWSRKRLRRMLEQASREGWITENVSKMEFALTDRGETEAKRLTRRHRLWELYLIRYADIAPQRVDRDADAIEHVLEPEIVAELETLLDNELGKTRMPDDPHADGVAS
ncbi:MULTISPECIES: metal ABC transporter permease [Pirellulaceae]|uniref:Manganese/zinc/iron transport system permease protein n=1 Tax=Aporhodopirellula rubra TaxID=980271 RepID=A0A7W5E218_9BACT|nr:MULTISPECIES: metal ABC transporter permease [Pirellulaceae]EMI41773.1 ABC-3 protein [Rhodopirellula sp. SWK7]MBB3207857.1 manganese/zinc/iron transport system permease protein [Aporhodopirellula rubra]